MKKIHTSIIALFVLLSSEIKSQVVPIYQVYAVAYTNTVRQDAKWSVVRNGPDSLDMSFMVWLIKGNNGKTILLDAGYLMSDSELKADKSGFIRPDVALQKLNIKPSDITDIIISHPHYDHIGGIDLFPKASVWMQKDDYDYFVGYAWQEDGNKKGFEKDHVKIAVNANLEGRLKLIKGDNIEIMDGIRVFIGSKHTYESQYVQVTTGKEKIILAADNVWFYHNLDNLLSVPLTFDTTGYINQMKRMKTLASEPRLIIPGHDGKLFQRFPKITEGVVKISKN
jgi:glyoxylase-like metal-dependent hydrolase (beta-lactamase superfamily II)